MGSRDQNRGLRKVFARNLQRERQQLRWSQEHLAERAGLSQVYVSQLENGKSAASIDTIEKIAAALGHEPANLLRKL